jgi:hypothetical protein
MFLANLPPRNLARRNKGTGGEVANALVCKTSIRRFNSGPVLHRSTIYNDFHGPTTPLNTILARPPSKPHQRAGCEINRSCCQQGSISQSPARRPIRMGIPLLRNRRWQEKAQDPDLRWQALLVGIRCPGGARNANPSKNKVDDHSANHVAPY